MTSEPRLWQRTMSESMALLHGSGMISMAPDTIKGLENTQDLGCHLRPGRDLRVMLKLGSYRSEWLALTQVAMVTSKPRLLQRTVSGPVVLPQPGSVLMSVVHGTKGHGVCDNVHGPCCHGAS